MVIRTKRLEVACEVTGPQDGRDVILLHGWPDDARTWDGVLPTLHAAGWRTIVPYLRGYGETRFRDASAMRSGQLSALGQDVIDLAHAMKLSKFAVLGHDWGARAAYIAASQLPHQVTHCVALSVGYGTNDAKQKLSFTQARNYWYHWYMALESGATRITDERREFTRFLWQTWSPAWRFTDEEFDATARSFDNSDWAAVVIHSYRHRWGLAPGDPAYAALEKALSPAPPVTVPTLVIHGGADACNDPATSAGREALFKSRYDRVVLNGLGHFPQREAPGAVALAITNFFA
jgi:pimeloyl-ACP methyl ester carboxylesterase